MGYRQVVQGTDKAHAEIIAKLARYNFFDPNPEARVIISAMAADAGGAFGANGKREDKFP